MEIADQAAVARRRGLLDLALRLTDQAFEMEREAAQTIESRLDLEPTRSVLHRSAASLALECNKSREAERLIGRALSGNPPEEIAEELRDLLEDVYFRRHLALRGIELQPDEFQLSLYGKGVGLGIAPASYFFPRIRDVEKLIIRTAERFQGREFREAGRPSKSLSKNLELYVSVPRPASFAVSFRLGSGQLELDLDGNSLCRRVITDLFDCFEFFNAENYRELERRIPDQTYFRNFIGLAEKIAPDGERILRVGFTATVDKVERLVALSSKRDRMSTAQHPQTQTGQVMTVKVQGTLLAANAKSQHSGRIQIVDNDGESHPFSVPRGMMSDIVKPMFEERVVVTARRRGKRMMLESIDLAEEDGVS